jgi:ApaG protein
MVWLPPAPGLFASVLFRLAAHCLRLPLDERPALVQNSPMYKAVTHNIQVVVEPEYLDARSEPGRSHYFWAYRVEITNLGAFGAQLTHRHWRITDGHGQQQEVRGAGVVGETPNLAPGQSFEYTSGCPLKTPNGIMAGSYRFVSETGEAFDVEIPAFSLDSPHARRVLN